MTRQPEAPNALDGVRLLRHVRIPMRDGVHLSADLFLPKGEGPWPVVIEYLPYRKDDRSHPRQALQAAMARRGIAGCRLDVRGTGSSEGILNDEYTETEQLDGVDAIAWLAAQPWCNGSVGMWGISYGGFDALQVAMHRPPALKAIVPVMFTDDRYGEECHYDGGSVRALYTWSDYPLMMVALNALPPHPDASDAPWLQRWRDRLEQQEPWVLPWLEHQVDGDYWANGSLNRDYGSVRCATFLIGGWRDGYPNAPLRTFAHLTCPKKVWVGPWTHMLPHEAFPGPKADYLEEAFRFFDHWLNGTENGVMDEDPVRLYVQEHGAPAAIPGDWPGRWRADPSLPETDDREWRLAEGGRLDPASGDGDADADQVADADLDAASCADVPYDPTVGTTGGIWCWATPVEQGEDDARSLLFDAAPLTVPLEIVGAGAVTFEVAFDRPVAGLAVRLEDVAPDGTSVKVTRGYRNATRRGSMFEPTPLPAHEPVRLTVPLDATAWRFRPGHRLRLAVACGEWPAIWPTPHPFRARLRLDRCRLSLPVALDEGRPLQLPAPAALSPLADASGAADDVWRTERDRLSGTSTVEVRKANAVRSLVRATEMDLAKRVVARLDPHDPARAVVEGSNTMHLRDFGHEVRTEATARMQGDEHAFHVQIRLTVQLDGEPFFERRWDRSVPRQLM
ncbi:MAG: CocE/NonD family hydrolase [Trueperaceae bacterium]